MNLERHTYDANVEIEESVIEDYLNDRAESFIANMVVHDWFGVLAFLVTHDKDFRMWLEFNRAPYESEGEE